MAFTKIVDSDLNDIGVIGLPDRPGLSTSAMQAKLEETARSVIIPKFNGLIDELEDDTAASNIGIQTPTGMTGATVQAVVNDIAEKVMRLDPESLSSKADKVTNAVEGNFAGLDSEGNLTDSGNKAADFAAASHTHTKSDITDFPTLATVATTGAYADLSGQPTLGTASALDVPASGNASSSQVVKGNDSRLSDDRNAADVYSWAKQSTKPSYTASEVGAIASTEKGANGGVAELDSNGKVPSAQLPSYVDDVEEYASLSDFPATGETGKIYIAKDTNKQYRWSGTAYVEISESLALGETSSTAYAGNKGKANADAISAIKDGATIDSFGDVELALSGKVDKVNGKGLSTNDYDDTAKGIVDGVTSALAGKQDKTLSAQVEGQTTVEGALGALSNADQATRHLLDDTVGWESKNILPQPFVASDSKLGLTYVNNGDSFTISGTSTNTSNSNFNVKSAFTLKAGTYILSGDVGNSNVYFSLRKISDDTVILNGNGEFTLVEDTEVRLAMLVKANTVLSEPLTYYPMIRKSIYTDSTFEPYHASVEQCKYNRSEANILGAKNLLDHTDYAMSASISSTLTDTGFNATADASHGYQNVSYYNVKYSRNQNLIVGKKYIVSLKVLSLSGNRTKILTYRNSVGTIQKTVYFTDVGKYSLEFTHLQDGYISIFVNASPTAAGEENTLSVSDIMVRLASDPDDTYEPYTKTNRELTTDKADNTVIAPVENGTTVQKSGGYAVGSHAIRNGAFITWKNAKAQGETIADSDYDSGDVADEMSPEKKNITTSNANITIASQICYKYGKVVNFAANFTASAEIPASTAILTLPYIPYIAVMFELYDSTVYTPVNYTVGTRSDNGTINTRQILPAGSYRISGTLICK